MGKTIQMHEGEAKICANVNFVGVGASKVKFTRKGEVKVWLTEALTSAHVKVIEEKTDYQVIGDVTPGRKEIRMSVPVAEETQALEATQAVAPAEALPTLPDTGQEGMSEEIKALQEAIPEAVITIAPNCQHPEYARHKSNGTEVCRLCGEVVKSVNGYEDVGELKRQNAELRQQLETADAVISKYLDRIMQLERALEPTRAAIAAKTQTTLEFHLFTCELKLDHPETLTQAAADLAALVNAGWRIAFEAVEQRTYIVRLERWPEPPDHGYKADAVAPEVYEKVAVEVKKAIDDYEASKSEPSVDAAEDSQPIVVDMPEPEPVFSIGQRVHYDPPSGIYHGKKRLPAQEATIMEFGDHRIHVLVDRSDGKQEAMFVERKSLHTLPQPTLALDASTEDAPKVEQEADCEPIEFHPLTPAEQERIKSGRGLVVSPWQKQKWLTDTARRAGQKVGE